MAIVWRKRRVLCFGLALWLPAGKSAALATLSQRHGARTLPPALPPPDSGKIADREGKGTQARLNLTYLSDR